MSKGEPIPYDDALRIAKKHLIQIGMMDRTEKIAIVGSLRRKEKEVGDIDYQVIGNPQEIAQYFYEREWHFESGKNKRQIFKAPSGLYLNCFYTERAHWGASLMHNTGPSRYNIRKRYLIKQKGGILNQYGLYKRIYDDDNPDDYELIASETEKDIYDALSWAYCKPEDRE